MHALVGFLLLLGVYTAHCDNVIFFDDFTDFDLSVWQHEITAGGGGNWEFEYYTNNRSNSYVRDSILYIKPTLTVETLGNPAYLSDGYVLSLWGTQPADLCTGNAFYGCERQGGAGGNILNPIQSARLRTVNSFNFKYGKVEVRAKLPKGDWLWPAIWMMPTYNSYGEWPASGEIDIVESRGNVNYPPGGVNQFGSTLHWAPFYGLDGYPLTHETYTLATGDFSDDFHIFGLIWNSTNIITYLDEPSSIVLNVNIDQPFWQRGGWNNSTYNNPWAAGGKDAPFDQKFYLVFNVAVGGTGGYFPDGVDGKPWSNSDPHAVNAFWDAVNDWYATWNGEDAAMQIDWVKVSQ